MLEVGRTVRGNTLIEDEFVVVRERGERLVYLAHPSGQPAAEFVSITASPNEVVFENAQHDFPQRVGYQRQGADLAALDRGHEGRPDPPHRFPLSSRRLLRRLNR